MPLSTTPPASPLPLVLLGHPGHELRVYGWLKRHPSEVWVFTDGSGAAAAPRTELTRGVLREAGATLGARFGDFTDRHFYAAILRGDHGFFVGLAREAARRLVSGRHPFVVSDAAEGYNPTHDLCEQIARAAAARAAHETGVAIPHYTFLLTGHPAGAAEQRHPDDLVADLDDQLGSEKIDAALAYARAVGGQLLSEVEETLARFGPPIFRHERLFRHIATDYVAAFAAKPPFYEEHGERRAQAGHYSEIIRHRTHMAPIAEALTRFGRGKD